MVFARSLLKSSHPLKNGHRRLCAYLPSQRNFSRSRTTNSSRQYPTAQCTLTLPRILSIRLQWSSHHCTRPLSARFASSATGVSSIDETNPESSATPTVSEEGLLSTPLDGFVFTESAPAYEHIGFLKELGLDYGWGPTAMMETLLEHVHIYTGTPWWASIGISLLLIRVSLLKIYIKAADAAARNQMIAPHNAPIVARMKVAQKSGDSLGMQRALKEMKDLRASAGFKVLDMVWPMVQIPIGFGFFRLMRGMAYLPVPGLDTGGLLWIQDLTVSDPFYVLPVLTAGCYYYSFKLGGDSGNMSGNTMLSPEMMKVFTFGLPIFSGVIMLAWPGALQLTFFIQSVITLSQSTALKQPQVREFLGIQPLPLPGDTKHTNQVYVGKADRINRTDAPPEIKGKGFFGGALADIRSAWSALRNKATKLAEERSTRSQSGRRTDAELRHAKAYDQRRRRELAQAAYERKEEAAAKLQEQEERRREKKRKLRH